VAGFGAAVPPTGLIHFNGASLMPGGVTMDLADLLAPLFGDMSLQPRMPGILGAAPGTVMPTAGAPGVAGPGGDAAVSGGNPGEAALHALLAPLFGASLAPAAPDLVGGAAPPAVASQAIAPAVAGHALMPAMAGHAFEPAADGGAFTPSAPDLPPISAAIPGESGLRALLAGLPASDLRTGVPANAPGPTAPSFYFLDQAGGLSQSEIPVVPAAAHPGFDAASVRADFPILAELVNGRPLIWLDNAATTQKPNAVIDRLTRFYRHENSNIHRAAHELAARATDAYEDARESVRRFLGAPSADNIVFVRGTTEGINLVAKSWGRRHVRSGDEIVITALEHHANIVPWQQLAAETGAVLRVAPVDDRGQIRLDEFEELLNSRTKLVAFSQVSNALGTVTPVQDMARLARRRGARVLVDGAQSVSHMPIDVQAMDCDWFVFSGHKLFAPTGIGAVYGRADAWEETPPWQGGGNMIRDVTFEKSEYQDAPARFEAGTANIADAVGLGAAIEYLERIGMANIAAYEHALLDYATRLLADIPGLRIIGTAAEKAGVISFVLNNVPPEEVGRALNQEGIAVRAGHHCAQPILRRFGVEATVRPSLAFYNTHADIDTLADAVRRIGAGQAPV
jgi:cysteine desulfurase/selenocysteine lyase